MEPKLELGQSSFSATVVRSIQKIQQPIGAKKHQRANQWNTFESVFLCIRLTQEDIRRTKQGGSGVWVGPDTFCIPRTRWSGNLTGVGLAPVTQ